MDITLHLKISNKSLLIESNHNCKFTRLNVLKLLLLFPLFIVKNAFHYSESVLFKVLSCRKDVFYRFMANCSIDWRKILNRINFQLIGEIAVRADSCKNKNPVCLMVDDSDLPKTGKKIERIGRIFSHVTHNSILGFKALFFCRTDGKTKTVLGFSLHGEEGSRPEKPFGITREQRSKQYHRDRKETKAVQEKIEEYTRSKIQKAVDMVRRTIKEGIRFYYLLCDSWFTCTDIVRFIKSRHARCHFLGMIKMAKTKYSYEGKMKSVRELVKLLHLRKEIRYSWRLSCYYGLTEVELSSIKVKFFFCRRTRNGDWTGLLTTNTKLDFFEAYHVYSMRWSVEVFFKEAKGLLGLGKSQARDFASQIPSISITMLQYNILGTVKRFKSYETIGGLFHQATDGVIQLLVTDRIWGILQELVMIIAEAFQIDDERVMDTLINRSETFKHFINLDKLELKQAA